MAFFPRAFYNNNANTTDASFTPLFRLLEDFDSYSRQSGSQTNNGRRSCLATTFQPKFDVRETGETYELHGELPGMVKENVHIEFTEPQTMLVRGRVERTYTAGTHPNSQVEDSTKTAPAAIAEEEDAPTERRNSHQATVEDEAEAEAHEAGWEDVASKKSDELTKEVAKPAQKPVDKAKYWLTERSIGEFSRSFNFPTRVNQDAVSASLKDGILTVTVPKAKKHEARRINIA